MIDKNLNKTDVLIEISRLYYYEKKSQQEIAELFDTTRSNVAKLLHKALDKGIVEIKIKDPTSNIIKLANQIKEKYNLRKVAVVETGENEEQTLESVGKMAANFLSSQLRENLKIGVSWGTTLFQMVEHMSYNPFPSCSVVQLHGGAGSKNMKVDGYELSRNLSLKLRCAATYIPAPLVVQSKEVKALLLKEPQILAGLELSESVDIAFLGIGTSIPEFSALVRAGYLKYSVAESLYKKGAVGMICGQFYDRNGELIDSEINELVVGLDAAKLHKIDFTVGVACGKHKVDAIYGAIKGGYINSIFTDEYVASRLLEDDY